MPSPSAPALVVALALCAAGCSLFCPCGGSAPGGGTPAAARAVLRDLSGKTVATAELAEVEGGVRIVLRASALEPGRHAFHIHASGACDPAEKFKSAGGHFNPHGKKHGRENPEGYHLGDLPNLEVGPDGTGSVEFVADGVTLRPGPDSLFDEDGSSLVIHAKEDDHRTDPAGGAGDRIACGTIQP